jgi:hypothetical protein
MPYTYVHLRKSYLVASFSSNQPCRDPPKKTINPLRRVRSHHCHRARHLRWAPRQRRRPHAIVPVPVLVRALSTRLPICLYWGASALCCERSWHVSSAAGGRYSAGPCPAPTRTILASKSFFKNPGVTDSPSVLYRQCAKRSRECEYPEMTWRGRGRKRSRSEHVESDDDEEEEDLELTPSRSKTRRIT